MDRNPHNFLLQLRCLRPALARRFDGMRTLGLSGGVLTVRAPLRSWPGSDLAALRGEVEAEAARFFGAGTRFAVEDAPEDPERLPFPVTATKHWNHVAFLSPEPGGFRALALSKTLYAALDPAKAEAEPDGEGVRRFSFREGADPLDALAPLLDWAAALAREASSYVQFVAAFPGDEAADRWEARLYAAKEWGTPRTPPALLARHAGRLHYADPAAPLLGIRLARKNDGAKFPV